VIVSRQSLVESEVEAVICAPVFSNGQALPTQVSVGFDEGLRHASWILCDNLKRIPKSDLTQYVGCLSAGKLAELDRALAMALDLAY
jgi:mRNA interferase MazF